MVETYVATPIYMALEVTRFTAVSKCQCEIIRNTQAVYLKDRRSNGTKLLKISREERISAEEIMKPHWLQESQVATSSRAGRGWCGGDPWKEVQDQVFRRRRWSTGRIRRIRADHWQVINIRNKVCIKVTWLYIIYYNNLHNALPLPRQKMTTLFFPNLKENSSTCVFFSIVGTRIFPSNLI